MKTIISLLLLFTFECFSQTVVTGNLEDYIDIYLGNIPYTSSSNEYQVPADSMLNLWGQTIEDIVNHKFFEADLKASLFGYRLVEFNDSSLVNINKLYLLEKTQSSINFWGMFIYNPEAKRQRLIIEAPHPLYDRNTGKQSLSIFVTSCARALIISGTHRCNSSEFSSCSGTTTACSSTAQKYRKSDQAHNIDGTFQKTTAVLLTAIENIIVIQPHGFSKGSSDPDLIMSNGTQLTPPIDYLTELRDNLLTIDNSLTFKIGHIDLSWTKLLATTNTQGRLINGSVNPCTLNPPSTTGRFLHIEQAYPKLRDSKTNWMKLADAITMTFPEEPVSYNFENQAARIHFDLKQNYPNPFNPSTTIEYSISQAGSVNLTIYDILGRKIKTLVDEYKATGSYGIKFHSDDLASGIYFYVLKTVEGIVSKKMILTR